MNTNMKWFLFANLWCLFLQSQDRSCLSSIDRKLTAPTNNTDVRVSNNRNWRYSWILREFSVNFNFFQSDDVFFVPPYRHWDVDHSFRTHQRLVLSVSYFRIKRSNLVSLFKFSSPTSTVSSASSTSCRSSVWHLSTDDRMHKTLLNFKLLLINYMKLLFSQLRGPIR